MQVIQAVVKWIRNQQGPGIVHFQTTPTGKAVTFPSKNDTPPPDFIRAGVRTSQPQPDDIEECVLVMFDGTKTFFAYPLASDQPTEALTVEEHFGTYFVLSPEGEADINVAPYFRATVEAWNDGEDIHIVVSEKP